MPVVSRLPLTPAPSAVRSPARDLLSDTPLANF
jgi:hypothetical protein